MRPRPLRFAGRPGQHTLARIDPHSRRRSRTQTETQHLRRHIGVTGRHRHTKQTSFVNLLARHRREHRRIVHSPHLNRHRPFASQNRNARVFHHNLDRIQSRSLRLARRPVEAPAQRVQTHPCRRARTQRVAQALLRNIRVTCGHTEAQELRFVHRTRRQRLQNRRLIDLGDLHGDALLGSPAGAVFDEDAHREAARSLGFARGPGERAALGIHTHARRRSRPQPVGQTLRRNIGVAPAHNQPQGAPFLNRLIAHRREHRIVVAFPNLDPKGPLRLLRRRPVILHDHRDRIRPGSLILLRRPPKPPGAPLHRRPSGTACPQPVAQPLLRFVLIHRLQSKLQLLILIHRAPADRFHPRRLV